MRLDLVLVGFGNVARRFVRLLDESTERLRRDHDLTWRVIAIATRRHGALCAPPGLDVARAIELVERGGSLDGLPRGDRSSSAAFIRQTIEETRHGDPDRRVVVVETTVLDIQRGQPAIDHVRAALAAGADVISANKGPVAFAARELLELAAHHHRAFLFEGSVMDGVPIFNLVRETLPALSIIGFRGVINSTTNYILTAMEEGRDFAAALSEMQAAGIAEADASFDVDGWDAAAKTAALVNVLMNGTVTPHSVARTGIRGLTGEAVRAAIAKGRRLRLVATGLLQDGLPAGRVAPEELPATDLLATLTGQENALVLRTDLLGEIGIVQRGSGLTATAYALLSDLVEVRRRL